MSDIRCPDCGNTDQSKMAAAARNRRIICLKDCYYSFKANPKTIPLKVRSPKVATTTFTVRGNSTQYAKELESKLRKANSLFGIIGKTVSYYALQDAVKEGKQITELKK